MLPGVGVFGTGSTARVLVPLLRAEGFSVEAVWGRTEEEARQLAEELGIGKNVICEKAATSVDAFKMVTAARYQKNTSFQEELLLADTSRLGTAVEKGLREVPLPYLKGMVCMVQALRQSFEEQEDRRTWEHKPVSMAASFEDGLYMQSVVDAIKQSSRSGEWEMVEIMTEEPDTNQNLCEALQRNNL
ncbi:UNVERIFIED_CONTAM: hypothetical protein FKN15_007620 [Acipenser sinensis]